MTGLLKNLRPSNLVLLAASPFLIYLFASNDNYYRSLVFIIGIEENAGSIFWAFLLLATALTLGIGIAILSMKDEPGRLLLPLSLVHLALLLHLGWLHDLEAFWHSAIGAMLDIRSSPWMVPTERQPTLTGDALDTLDLSATVCLSLYALIFGLLALRPILRGLLPSRSMIWLVFAVNLAVLLYLLLFAHLGFATGLFVTLRAAVLAYIVAAVLGLGLAGLLGLTPGMQTLRHTILLTLALAIGSGVLLTRAEVSYRLVGSTEQRVAIIGGTPSRLSDVVKTGNWPGGDQERHQIRGADSIDRALDLLMNDERISGALLPADAAPEGMPVIWEVSVLPDHYRTPGLILAVLALLLALFTLSAWQRQRHPLSVFAEFFVDVVRGIPMLVIILYIGLPLSGALKDATGGFFDLPNMVRGMIAISIGYSAYMAEIFRAGIEAIPRGQIEAAQSLGLSRWQTARLVILPQAIRIVVPPLGNEFIAMLKDTSLLSILSVRDLTQRTREFQSASFLPFAPFNTAAILYVVLTLMAASGLKWVERRTERRGY
ncbi:MAG: amino acid ABC transporter permease [Geminicoccaceae bacterium]